MAGSVRSDCKCSGRHVRNGSSTCDGNVVQPQATEEEQLHGERKEDMWSVASWEETMKEKVSSFPAGRGCCGGMQVSHTHKVVPAIKGARSHEQGILERQKVLDLTGQPKRQYVLRSYSLRSSIK
jgi:hypothetical protein